MIAVAIRSMAKIAAAIFFRLDHLFFFLDLSKYAICFLSLSEGCVVLSVDTPPATVSAVPSPVVP